MQSEKSWSVNGVRMLCKGMLLSTLIHGSDALTQYEYDKYRVKVVKKKKWGNLCYRKERG